MQVTSTLHNAESVMAS